MPAKSLAQKRLMDAAAHNPAFAKKVGIPTKVAEEFSQASKGQTFTKGSEMKTKKMMDGGRTSLPPQAVARAIRALDSRPLVRTMGARSFKEGGSVKPTAMGKVTAGGKRAFGEHTIQQKGHTRGKQVVMKKGGKC